MNDKKIKYKVFILCGVLTAFFLQGCGNTDLQSVNSNGKVINGVTEESIKESPKTGIFGDEFTTNKSSTINEDKNSPLYFSEEISSISVKHSNGGGQKSWDLQKESYMKFRKWVMSLQLKQKKFKEGEKPGDYNGGDAYSFEIVCGSLLKFTYIDMGDGNKYIEKSGKWYIVINHEELPDFI